MMSKKDMATLGLLAIGGVGAALMISGGGEGLPGGGGLGLGLGEEREEALTKKETVTYAEPGVIKPPTLPSFRDIFAMPAFLKPKPVPAAAAAAAQKKIGLLPTSRTGVTPYLYTGGEVTPGAYTLAPSPGTGISPYLYTGGAVGLGAFTPYGAPAPTPVTTAKKPTVTGRKATPGRMGYSAAARRAGFA